MKRTLSFALALLAATAALQPGGFAQTAALHFLAKPTLVECEPESSEPCFRLTFGVAGDSGKPVQVALPPAEQLSSHIEVQLDDETVKPFYAVAASGTSQARRPQTTLLLFDVSGSMLRTDLGGQSRFDAAKTAAAEFLRNFSDGVDQVAIVPFASREVENTIASAHFVTTRAEAAAQLAALPQPQSHNNTALYSAVRAAVLTLQHHRQPAGGRPKLILLTDGANDVHPESGDDPGLLTGPAGLAAAASAVHRSGVDVLPIGLGNRQSIDEVAMVRLGTQPPLITFDVDALHKAFELQQIPQGVRITVLFQVPPGIASRTLLAGRVIRFRAKLTLPDGTALVEDRQALWVAPPLATPSFEGEASESEQRAFLANARLDRGSLFFFLRPFLVFACLATLLALLWFVLPRFLWPERYDKRSARPVRPEYWPGVDPASRRDPQRRHKPPPGFETAPRAAARTPGEHTIVRPITSMDVTKTRLS